MSILQEGRNCWKITTADRWAFLVDGEEYFSALVKALQTAQRSVAIVAWDINSEIELLPDQGEKSPRLGRFLADLLQERQGLVARLLVWYPPIVYGIDREYYSKSKFEALAPERMHFGLDSEHPIGASQHQKIVVIDGRIAFNGGMDPTAARWDCREHKLEDERRRHPVGHTYHVTHDIQACVTGATAAALGELITDRWQKATGERIKLETVPGEATLDLPWVIEKARVGIARTYPEYKDRLAVKESCQLYCDLIAEAKDHIYIENQYFTSGILTDALRKSLRKGNGPAITVVIPLGLRDGAANGLLDMARLYRLKQLQDADRHNRLSILCPHLEGSDCGVYVHSKVMVVDDEYAVVGSSNCSDRSMGLDSECDLVLDAEGRADVREAIRDFREGLLAEHSGLALPAFREALARHESLPAFVKVHSTGSRALRPFEVRALRWWQKILARLNFIDTAEPSAIDRVIDTVSYAMLHREPRAMLRRVLMGYGLLIVALIGLAGLWWGIREPAAAQAAITSVFYSLQGHPAAPVFAVLLFIAGTVLFVPYNALTIAVATLFPAHIAVPVSLIGGTASAVVSYGMGRFAGASFLKRLFSHRINRVGEFLRGQGLMPIIFLRLLPIAPFTIVNIIAGAFKVPLMTFTIGSFLGLLPGALLLIAFQRSFISFIEEPNWRSGIFFTVALLIISWLIWALRRRLGTSAVSSAHHSYT